MILLLDISFLCREYYLHWEAFCHVRPVVVQASHRITYLMSIGNILKGLEASDL